MPKILCRTQRHETQILRERDAMKRIVLVEILSLVMYGLTRCPLAWHGVCLTHVRGKTESNTNSDSEVVFFPRFVLRVNGSCCSLRRTVFITAYKWPLYTVFLYMFH